ncbi:hypothetical protein GOBAR_DD25925 [Gossypium barbadense]|nr:hypothetical protein GOBAR_DD25925 [Gossypium barbadense]
MYNICNTVGVRWTVMIEDLVAQKHISLVVILVKIADEWKTSHGGTLPSTREGKKNSRMAAMDENIYKEAIDASFN